MNTQKKVLLINPDLPQQLPAMAGYVEKQEWSHGDIKDFFSSFFSSSTGPVKWSGGNIIDQISDLVLEDKRKVYVWDEMSKLSEMTYIRSRKGLEHPVVDLCCGYGYWISKTLETIDLGIDLFPDEGRFKRSIEGMEKNGFADNTYRSVLAHDVTKTLPLPDHSVSTVTCICSLEHVADYQAALREIKRILKPGGTLVLTVDAKVLTDVLTEVFSESYCERFIKEHQLETLLSADAWVNTLEESGFRVTDVTGFINRVRTYLYLTTFYPTDYTSYWTEMGFTELFKKNESARTLWNTVILPCLTERTDPSEAMIVGLTAISEG